MFINYLNDLALTGLNDKGCLKLFWPSFEQTIYRLEHDLPRWMQMLQDGKDTCCFAVAIDTCLVHSEESFLSCQNSGHPRGGASRHIRTTRTNFFSTTINLQENPTAKLPLTPGGILKLNSGRLSIASEYREGCAQWADFWLPNVLNQMNELVVASDAHRLGPRTHTELLDSNRATGSFVDVCIVDR
jgi:hypothetical protein